MPSLEHLIALSDDVGIVQHAVWDVPNRSTGYCTDDVARAFMVALAAAKVGSQREEALRLARRYLAFLIDAQLPDGRFHNFMSYDRAWLDDVGTQDANGRAIWALGYGLRFAPRESWREVCRAALERALPHVPELDHVRSRVYAALGLTHAVRAGGSAAAGLPVLLRGLGEDLRERYERAAAPGWDWFENSLTYDNARLPEAALRIGMVLEDRALVDLGLKTLRFYESITIEEELFVPIGNAGWYVRGASRARYGQQPLEAASLVDAALAAQAASGDARYGRLASIGLGWYGGRNSRGTAMVVAGGCFDGLEEGGPNRNMGAESTLAYLASALALADPATKVARDAREEVRSIS
ncbi:MAG: hypothetical protein WCE83_10490 [Candidatus Baltobacteraceae bacterium]